MPFLKVDGLDLYCERHGESGEPLVLVHGYTGDITDWRHQLPEFSATHKVLIMDNRGHGKSQAPADRRSYTIERMSRDVEELAAAAGFERYHLLGHSMGGAMAQEIALRSPNRLLSLTLHDTAYRLSSARSQAMVKWGEYRRKVADEQGMRALAELPSPAAPLPFMPAERLAETKERLAHMSADGFVGAGIALNEWPGTKDRLASIRTPTLVIYGDLDAEGLVLSSTFIAETIPGATLAVIPQAGHSPQYERPELFNAALRAHLQRNAEAPPK